MPEIAVMDAIADARLQGATGKNELYEKAAHYLTERMTCDLIITEHVRFIIIHFFVKYFIATSCGQLVTLTAID